jgi:hypothetical protein
MTADPRIARKVGTVAGVAGRLGPNQTMARICAWCGAGLTPTALAFAARGVPVTSGICDPCLNRFEEESDHGPT